MKISNIETCLLRTFVSIYETRNFTKTAEKLFRSQSAITMQMQKLEELLGCKLTYKNKRHIEITNAGMTLLPYAREILRLNDEIRFRFDRSNEECEIRVGTSDDYAVMLLSKIFEEFSEDNPDIPINTICANRNVNLERFNKGELDILLIPTRKNETLGEIVRSEPLSWVGSDDTEISSENSVPLAGFPTGCLCRELMIKALNQNKRTWSFLYSSDSAISLHSAIKSGRMITAMEESTIPDGAKILDGKFNLPFLPNVNISSLYSKINHRRATKKFYDFLIDVMRRAA